MFRAPPSCVIPENLDPSGAGYMQYDLVALDRRSAVASLKFILDSGNGVLTPSIGGAVLWSAWRRATTGSHHKRWRMLKDAIGPDIAVVRMPTTLNGQTYAAVRFQSEDVRSTYVWMFEEATGLLLFHRYELRYANGDTEQAGQLAFVAMRDLDLPWRATRMPAWAKRGANPDLRRRLFGLDPWFAGHHDAVRPAG